MVLRLVELEMGIERELCSGEAAPVDQARVYCSVRDNEVGRAGESCENAEVGLVPSGEEQGGGESEQ
jgi:hypothetical protein